MNNLISSPGQCKNITPKCDQYVSQVGNKTNIDHVRDPIADKHQYVKAKGVVKRNDKAINSESQKDNCKR